MCVALHHRAVRVVEVHHLGAVDIPDVRAATMGQIDGPWLPLLVRGSDTPRERLPRAFVEGARALRPLVEPPLLALRQLGDARAVEIGRRGSAHPFILSHRAVTRTGSRVWALDRCDLRPL